MDWSSMLPAEAQGAVDTVQPRFLTVRDDTSTAVWGRGGGAARSPAIAQIPNAAPMHRPVRFVFVFRVRRQAREAPRARARKPTFQTFRGGAGCRGGGAGWGAERTPVGGGRARWAHIP